MALPTRKTGATKDPIKTVVSPYELELDAFFEDPDDVESDEQGFNSIPTYGGNETYVTNIVNETSGVKTVTKIVGPSSNSDSDTYDYKTDGTADDIQINAALNALPTNGGAVLLREGTYELNSGVASSITGARLTGVGAGTIITTKVSYTDSYMIQLSGDTSSVSKIHIKPTGTGDTGIADTDHITDCWFTLPSSYAGVAIDNVSGIVSNCYFTTGINSLGAAVVIDGANEFTVEGCHFAFAGSTDSTSSTVISGGNGRIIGNSFYGGGTALSTTNDWLISGNHFQNSADDTIVVGGRTTITGNIFEDCCQAADDTYSVIFLGSTSDYSVVDGNIVTSDAANQPKYCVREFSASSGPNIISNNVLLNAVTTNLSTQHASTLSDNNITS